MSDFLKWELRCVTCSGFSIRRARRSQGHWLGHWLALHPPLSPSTALECRGTELCPPSDVSALPSQGLLRAPPRSSFPVSLSGTFTSSVAGLALVRVFPLVQTTVSPNVHISWPWTDGPQPFC